MIFISRDVYFYEQIFPFKERGMNEPHYESYAPVLLVVEFTTKCTKPIVQESTTEDPTIEEVSETHHTLDQEELVANLKI